MRMACQPDKRYFFGVADRTEPSGGQGFQYDRLVRSILYEAGSDIHDIERGDHGHYLRLFCIGNRV